jgi:hypothetical protein
MAHKFSQDECGFTGAGLGGGEGQQGRVGRGAGGPGLGLQAQDGATRDANTAVAT